MLNAVYSIYYIIIGLWIWPGAWLKWARAGRRRRVRTDDGRIPAAGVCRARGWRRARQGRGLRGRVKPCRRRTAWRLVLH